MEKIYETVSRLMTPGKGILAMDESNETADKRLKSVEVTGSPDMRRKYRDLFLSTEGLEKYISGVIFYDETLRQNASTSKPFAEHVGDLGIVPGIKVDTGAKDTPNFPGEKITSGLEDLEDRLPEYQELGARFTKWRVVINIDEQKKLPTNEAILQNAIKMAKYAKIVQNYGLVPIVEPEVLLEGIHSMKKAEHVIEKVLKTVFQELEEESVDLKGLILKTSMVVPGNKSDEEMDPIKVAKATVRVLKESVPKDVGGIVFLSGGQTPEEARDNLNAIASLEPLPWEIAFSYARAIQGPALEIWRGEEKNEEQARREFIKWLEFDTKADKGALDMESEF